MTETITGLNFDPGFAPYVLAFQGTVEYLYADINRFKNLSQKKIKFMQYHKKILEVFYNNVGFYTGCLMWASYLKKQSKQEIMNNPCLGNIFDEKTDTKEPDFLLEFVKLFPRDMKYYLAQEFAFEKNFIKIIEIYKQFLILNKGFVDTKFNSDIVLPEDIKTSNTDLYNEYINKSILEHNLNLLTDYISNIID